MGNRAGIAAAVGHCAGVAAGFRKRFGHVIIADRIVFRFKRGGKLFPVQREFRGNVCADRRQRTGCERRNVPPFFASVDIRFLSRCDGGNKRFDERRRDLVAGVLLDVQIVKFAVHSLAEIKTDRGKKPGRKAILNPQYLVHRFPPHPQDCPHPVRDRLPQILLRQASLRSPAHCFSNWTRNPRKYLCRTDR